MEPGHSRVDEKDFRPINPGCTRSWRIKPAVNGADPCSLQTPESKGYFLDSFGRVNSNLIPSTLSCVDAFFDRSNRLWHCDNRLPCFL